MAAARASRTNRVGVAPLTPDQERISSSGRRQEPHTPFPPMRSPFVYVELDCGWTPPVQVGLPAVTSSSVGFCLSEGLPPCLLGVGRINHEDLPPCASMHRARGDGDDPSTHGSSPFLTGVHASCFASVSSEAG